MARLTQENQIQREKEEGEGGGGGGGEEVRIFFLHIFSPVRSASFPQKKSLWDENYQFTRTTVTAN